MDESGLRFLISIMDAETSTFIAEQDFVMAARCSATLSALCAELVTRLPEQTSVGY